MVLKSGGLDKVESPKIDDERAGAYEAREVMHKPLCATSINIPNAVDMTSDCPEEQNRVVRPLLAQILSRHDLPQLAYKNDSIALIDLKGVSCQLGGREGTSGLESLLSPDEQSIYAGFSYPKRRVEWLGGRLAAKYALEQLLKGTSPFAYEAFSILPDGHGRPVLSCSSASLAKVSISISHSVDYAAAMASMQPRCGIDIQCNSDRLLRVRERFAPDAELAMFKEEHDHLARLSMVWTVKEAVKKCYLAAESTFFGAIQLTGAQKRAENFWQVQCRLAAPGGAEATVHVVLFARYALASVRGGNHA